MPVNFDEYVEPTRTLDFDTYQETRSISFDDYQVNEVESGLVPAEPITEAVEKPGIVEQVVNLPKVARVTGAETGLTTAGGFELSRARSLRDQAKSPVGLEGRLLSQAGYPRTPEARLANAIDKANLLSAERAEQSGREFLEAASTAPEDYGLDPKLETGLITQAGRGLSKGAGMYAVAAVGGIPALALQGSTEAYGSAKQAGKSDDEADKEATRALIGLAVFAGASKGVTTGIAKYLGNTSKLRSFLVQTLGNSVGNEVTSRSISAYEAALDAEPGKRMDAAVEAMTKNDAATITQNIGYALMSGFHSTSRMVKRNRNELQLEEVAGENARRDTAESERTARIIEEQNVQASRLGEQRKAQGAEFVQPSPEALTPEVRARAESTAPIITGEVAPSPPQQGPQEEIQVDLESGTVKTPDGRTVVVEETGVTEVVPGSPKDISTQVLVPKKPAEPVTEPPKVTPEIIGTALKSEGEPITGRSPTEPHLGIILDDVSVRSQLPKGSEGFLIIDENGVKRWADRVEAGKIAKESGLIPTMEEGEALTSEHLNAKVPGKEPTAEGLAKINEAFKAQQKSPEVESVQATPVEAPPGPPPKPEAPIENRGRPPLPERTSIQNAEVDANRVAQGLPPRMEPLRRTFGEEWSKAMEIVERNSDAGSALVAEIVEKPRALTPTESALLSHEQVTRENAYNEALRAVNEATNEVARNTAETALSRARDRNQEVYDAGQRVGTESGQSLAFRKMMVNRDYSLASMSAELLALKGGKNLTEKQKADVETEVQALHSRIKQAEERALKAEERLAQAQGYEEWLKLQKIARKESSAARNEGKSILDRMISNGESAMERIKTRNKSGRSMMSMTVIDPVDFIDYVQVGAGYIAKGIKTVGEFTKRLASDFGEDIAPHGERIFESSSKFHEEAVSRVPKVNTVEQAAAKDAEGTLNPQVVYDVARAHVNAGVQGFEPVMQATTATLKAKHPEITPREVRDVFSGYGKVTRPSLEADKIKLSEYKELARIASAIEDTLKGKPPLKTGFQRNKPTEEVRSQLARLKRLMEENGIQVTSPEQQLATAERAATTRLQNTIESLERQIATKTRDTGGQRNTPDSPEIKALRAKADELRKTLDEVAPRPGETEAQKLDRSIAATEKRIADLDAQLKEGAQKTPKPSGPTSPKLERLKSELTAMNRLARELRSSKEAKTDPAKRQLETALKNVDKQITELDRQLREGDIQPKSGDKKTQSTELDRKRAERDSLRAFRDELRNLSRPRLTENERAIKAVQKSLEAIENEILTGTRKAAKTGNASSPELEALKMERDQMRMHLNEIRNAGKTRKTPEEIALQRYKSGLATRTKNIQDRIAANDYAKKAKKETALDAEALTARFEYQKAKDAFEQKAFEYDLSRRGAAQRSYDAILEVLNTSRSIMTSFDVSAPLRQGAFITLAHPIRSLKNFPGMFKAFASEKAEYKLQQSLTDPTQRPNAALYRQSGLDLTETGPNVSRRKLEEAYQSRFAHKIPIVAGSQRAYTTFLNQLRADSFDSMVKNLGNGGKVTDVEAKAIASFINNATGRVKFPGGLEQSTALLNAVFFSPKFVASRFKMVADPFLGFSLSSGIPFTKGSVPRVRKAIAWEYARFMTGAAIVLGLSQLGGADVETDPTSSDFLSIKNGNTRLDILGGFKQIVTLEERIRRGERKELATGRIKKLKGTERIKTLDTFLEYKYSPAHSAFRSFISEKTPVGAPTTRTAVAIGLVTPMPFGDIVDAMVEQGVPRGTAISLVALFGASMSTFDAKQREKVARQPWEELMRDLKAIQRDPIGGRRN